MCEHHASETVIANAQNRRQFLRNLVIGAAGFSATGAVLQSLTRTDAELDRDAAEILADPATLAFYRSKLQPTPYLTEGPFYPYEDLPVDTDNDLLVIGSSTVVAQGPIVQLSGRVLRTDGEPVKGAKVHIWQVDSTGAYIHKGSEGHEKRDKAFQGIGIFETDTDGRYTFRTVRPVAYPGRTPHIHIAVDRKDQERFTTQVIDSSSHLTPNDGVLRSIRSPELRKLVLADFTPTKDAIETKVEFDVVLSDAIRV